MTKYLEKSYLTIPNDLSFLAAIQAYTSEVAKAIGFQKSDIQMMLLALEEAVVNVVKHAFDPDEKATYQIILEPMSSGLKIIVKDKGLPFAPNLVPEYTAPARIDDRAGTGLGSFLMRKSVDEISFNNLGREGKELHLIKYLPYKSFEDYHKEGDFTPFPHPDETKPRPTEKKPFSVRLLSPSETPAISMLFYRAYGYTYGIDAIYYPEKFSQLLQEGKIISVVSVTEDNHLVGHIALIRESLDDKTAEAGMSAVQPDFRGHGCANIMMERLIEEGRKAGLMGIYSKATTNHVYAQKSGQKSGFVRCAIGVGAISADRSYKGIEESLSQRVSVAYGFRRIRNPLGITLFPPEHHAAFIEKIYKNIGLDRAFRPSPESLPADTLEQQSSISTTVQPLSNRAFIEIYRYGRNVVPEVRTILKDLCLKKVDQIMLHLNLEDPFTGMLCSRFEELGFFIAGILPFHHFGDALLLQYLNNIPIDYSNIRLASVQAQEMLEYVKAHDPNIV